MIQIITDYTEYFVKKFLKYFLILFIIYQYISVGYGQYVKEIYVFQDGNNELEAKVKAYHYAMNKAFKILCDKKQLYNDSKNISYKELKNIFQVLTIHDERVTQYSYQAVIDFVYDISNFYSFIFANKQSKLDNLFYDYFLILVRKTSEKLEIVNEQFISNLSKVEQKELKNLIYGKLNLYIPLLGGTTFSNQKIDFNKFALEFEDILFKSVLVVKYELFTNTRDMSQSLFIDSSLINYDNNVKSKNHTVNLKGRNLSTQNTYRQVVEYLIKNYSDQISVTKTPKNNAKKKERAVTVKTPDLRLYFTTQSLKVLDSVKVKMSKVDSSVMNFTISQTDVDFEYVFDVYLQAKVFDLVEEFYVVGLSYAKEGEKYFLINKVEGV